MTANPAGLRRRRLLIVAGYGALLLLIAAAGADRLGWFGYRGDDWSHFNRRAVRADQIVDGDTFTALVVDAPGDPVSVRLLGIDAPDAPSAHWSAAATKYLKARLVDRGVTLRLDGTQTRSADGQLLAYVYVTDGDCVNFDAVRDGQAYVDRRVKHGMRSPMEQAEREARSKKRGLWKELRDQDMPAWRLEWLRNLSATHRTSADRSKSD